MSALIVPHRGFAPKVARSAFIAPNATLVGDVEIGENASIWFGVILRGDGPGIRIGDNSNLQDGTVVHVAARGLMTVVGRNVTVGHKANIMRYSDGLFLRTAREDSRAFPDVPCDEIQIDHLTSRLALEPSAFDVLLLPNLYGDIISDLCAGLVGGLGLIPGANIGWEYAVFEAVHGSAPDIAGQGKADPIAMILSGAMLLRHLGEVAAAENVEWAVDEVLRQGRIRTPDLGGDASTMQVAEEIAMTVSAWEHGPS